MNKNVQYYNNIGGAFGRWRMSDKQGVVNKLKNLLEKNPEKGKLAIKALIAFKDYRKNSTIEKQNITLEDLVLPEGENFPTIKELMELVRNTSYFVQRNLPDTFKDFLNELRTKNFTIFAEVIMGHEKFLQNSGVNNKQLNLGLLFKADQLEDSSNKLSPDSKDSDLSEFPDGRSKTGGLNLFEQMPEQSDVLSTKTNYNDPQWGVESDGHKEVTQEYLLEPNNGAKLEESIIIYENQSIISEDTRPPILDNIFNISNNEDEITISNAEYIAIIKYITATKNIEQKIGAQALEKIAVLKYDKLLENSKINILAAYSKDSKNTGYHQSGDMAMKITLPSGDIIHIIFDAPSNTLNHLCMSKKYNKHSFLHDDKEVGWDVILAQNVLLATILCQLSDLNQENKDEFQEEIFSESPACKVTILAGHGDVKITSRGDSNIVFFSKTDDTYIFLNYGDIVSQDKDYDEYKNKVEKIYDNTDNVLSLQSLNDLKELTEAYLQEKKDYKSPCGADINITIRSDFWKHIKDKYYIIMVTDGLTDNPNLMDIFHKKLKQNSSPAILQKEIKVAVEDYMGTLNPHPQGSKLDDLVYVSIHIV